MPTIDNDWAEGLALVGLVVAFLFAVLVRTPSTTYAIAGLMGLMIGRIWYRLRRRDRSFLFVISTGILLGFLLGMLNGDVRVLIIIYCVAGALSYFLHAEKLVRSVEF